MRCFVRHRNKSGLECVIQLSILTYIPSIHTYNDRLVGVHLIKASFVSDGANKLERMQFSLGKLIFRRAYRLF